MADMGGEFEMIMGTPEEETKEGRGGINKVPPMMSKLQGKHEEKDPAK